MTLDDIQLSIYQGEKGITNALELVETYVQKKNLDSDKISTIKHMSRLISSKMDTVPAKMINQIKVTERYRNYIKEIVTDEKLTDAVSSAKKIYGIAEVDSNRRIISAKESDTKRNREFEKNEVLRFFKTNFTSLVTLLEIYNLLIDIKNEINR